MGLVTCFPPFLSMLAIQYIARGTRSTMAAAERFYQMRCDIAHTLDQTNGDSDCGYLWFFLSFSLLRVPIGRRTGNVWPMVYSKWGKVLIHFFVQQFAICIRHWNCCIVANRRMNCLRGSCTGIPFHIFRRLEHIFAKKKNEQKQRSKSKSAKCDTIVRAWVHLIFARLPAVCQTFLSDYLPAHRWMWHLICFTDRAWCPHPYAIYPRTHNEFPKKNGKSSSRASPRNMKIPPAFRVIPFTTHPPPCAHTHTERSAHMCFVRHDFRHNFACAILSWLRVDWNERVAP